jgi:hypothetical protein
LRSIRAIVLTVLSLAFVTAGGTAMANVCRSIQAELAAIGRGGGGSAAAAAAEAQRVHHHMRSIGCDRSGIFAFGAPPPPECGGLRARFNQLQHAASSGVGSEGRRRELMSMLVSYNCRTSPEPRPRSEPLVAGLLDDRARRPSSLEIRPDEDAEAPRFESRIRSIGGRAVCVRTCDGYFFPVQVRPGTPAEDGDSICQSLCPSVETRLFTLRSREIEDAVSLRGEPYSDLPNAFLYRKRFNPACACRADGTGNGPGTRVLNPEGAGGAPFETLNPETPDMIESPPLRGFDARPQPKGAPSSAFGNRPPPPPPAPPHPPGEMSGERQVTADQGEVREFEARDGSRRTVRIIAPELARGPSEAKAPSAPARAPAP